MKKIISAVTAAMMMLISAASASASDSNAVPADYQSALDFYNSAGETAVMKNGKDIAVVLPCFNTEKYRYVLTDSDGYTVNSSDSYYSREADAERGFEVYSISLDSENDIELKFEYYNLEDNEKVPNAEAIELKFNYDGNGEYSADYLPRTAKQAELLIDKGGAVVNENKICIALKAAKGAGYDIFSLNNTQSGSLTGLSEPVLISESSESSDNSVCNMRLIDGKLDTPVGGSEIKIYEYKFDKEGPYNFTFAEKRGENRKYANKIYDIGVFSSESGLEIKSNNEYAVGDVTLDGNIDVFDAINIAKFTVDSVNFNSNQEMLADCNMDNTIDVFDAITIARRTVAK